MRVFFVDCPLCFGFICLTRVCTCTPYALSHTHVNLYVYTRCPFVFVLHLFACPLCCGKENARVCTCTPDVLCHTHVNFHVYSCCPLFVFLHVLLAHLMCFYLSRVCTCIIAHTCKFDTSIHVATQFLFCMVACPIVCACFHMYDICIISYT